MVDVVSPPGMSHHSSNPMETYYGVGGMVESDDPIAIGSAPARDSMEHIRQKQRRRSAQVEEKVVEQHEDEGLEAEVEDGEDELLLGADEEQPTQEEDTTLLDQDETMHAEGDEEQNQNQDEQDDEEQEEEAGSDDDIASLDYSTDEDRTLELKPVQDQAHIRAEFKDLEAAMPQLAEDYQLIDRLGTGTFSSVYKARDLRQHEFDNSVWQGGPNPGSNLVAIKRIYVTSSPERIRNEIAILADVLGSRNVAQLITAFRVRDQVVAIMPYHRNDDFRTFFNTLPISGWQAYFRCLFRALRDIHARRIIHRDVKPANFLFDVRTLHGTLVDFGLAQYIEPLDGNDGACNHTSASVAYPHGELTDLDPDWRNTLSEARRDMRARRKWPSERVGWPADEKGKHQSRANRAGTRGFRAPEVLLKCNDQSGAIDIWAAGTILLFFLTKRFPIYGANDDIEALMELATIIGHKRLEKAALLHNRSFITNVPSIPEEGTTWRALVLRLNPSLFEDHPDDADSLDDALELLERCLEPEAPRRITARGALYSEFLREVRISRDEDAMVDGGEYTEEDEDDNSFVHPPGQGACASLHRKDEVTGQWLASVPRDEIDLDEDETSEAWKPLMAGEGLCTGREPCVYHRDARLPPFEWVNGGEQLQL